MTQQHARITREQVAEWCRLRDLAVAEERRDDADRVCWTLAHAHDHLVPGFVRRWGWLLASEDDAAHEAALGLFKASQRFDPARGVQFSTYAVWWVCESMMAAVNAQSGHSGRTQELLRNIAKCEDAGIVDDADVAEYLGKSVETIRRARAADLTPVPEVAMGETLGLDDDPTPGIDQAQVVGLLDELSEREAAVLRLRHGLDDGDPLTLGSIGERLGLSRERVRQIEGAAIRRLRERLKLGSAKVNGATGARGGQAGQGNRR